MDSINHIRSLVFPYKLQQFFKRVRACGIIGIYSQEEPVNVQLYEGLLMLQHRGQDSAGMVTTNWTNFKEVKENGLVKDVFKDYNTLRSLEGNSGIAHVRYPTAGAQSAHEAQPFFVNSPLGIYLIHNGNLTNTEYLRSILESSKSFFNRHLQTGTDSEVLLNLFADEIHRAHQTFIKEDRGDPMEHKQEFVISAMKRVMQVARGAYSCLCLVKGVGLVAFRDPHGIRPLVLGSRQEASGKVSYCIASEDSSFGPLGFSRVRDVECGELIIIEQETGKLVSINCAQKTDLHPCVFEYIYLARPDSTLNDISVYSFQLGLGTKLAKQIQQQNWDIDTIVPVPDGSRPAAIQISAELHIPYREGLVKNRYVGRTFIMPDQRTREISVRRKLNVTNSVFKGKKVCLVDDSIVRGTTMRQIVDMVRKAGAEKVYLASASPPVRYPNVYGVDMPSRQEFVAYNKSIDQICEELNADGLLYQCFEDLEDVGRTLNPQIQNFDTSCFSGKYLTGDIDEEYIRKLEESGRGKNRQGIKSRLDSSSSNGSNNGQGQLIQNGSSADQLATTA